jgi:hypothetical protein
MMRTSIKHDPVVLPGTMGKSRTRWLDSVLRLKSVFGIDRAIAYTVLARSSQVLGSTVTVLLIVRFLTPIEQGYYYTLLSLTGLQAVFELGFSFVILQMAAHECVHLKLHSDGRIEGDPVAHARLASILKQTVRWYTAAASLMVITLLPLGTYFFARHQHAGYAVHWQWPWAVAVLACAWSFQINAVLSFLEGCGQVPQVARMRFRQALIGIALSWTATVTQHGLFSPAMAMVAWGLVGAGFLWKQRVLLASLLRHSVPRHGIHWSSEVWPFQWRVGVSWLCSYFTMQVFTPVLFAYSGPVEAGRMGLSLNVTAQLLSSILPWMSTKAAAFGNMVASGNIDRLDEIFFRTLQQSLTLLLAVALGVVTALVGVDHFFPRLASRIESVPIFALLLFTMLCSYVVQCEAMYLRAHKCEPFLVQSVVIASATLVSGILSAQTWGSWGIALTYFVCTGVIGLISGTAIFRARRRAWRSEKLPPCRTIGMSKPLIQE